MTFGGAHTLQTILIIWMRWILEIAFCMPISRWNIAILCKLPRNVIIHIILKLHII
jgi:hypothetical protein